MNFSTKDFFNKSDVISRNLRIRFRLLKKSLVENFISCAVILTLASLTVSLLTTQALTGFVSLLLLDRFLLIPAYLENETSKAALKLL